MDFNGTFFAAIISFLIFVIVMNKMLYEPVRRIVKERNDFIDGNLSKADENTAKADLISQECEKRIINAKEDAREKYNELLDGYKEQKSNIVKEAQNQALNELEQEYANLSNLSDEAKESLKWRMTELANDIVEKFLGYRSDIQGFDNDKVNQILYQQKG